MRLCPNNRDQCSPDKNNAHDGFANKYARAREARLPKLGAHPTALNFRCRYATSQINNRLEKFVKWRVSKMLEMLMAKNEKTQHHSS